ncbi:MAG: manganese efflux pump [Lachnospiraceae bacterium]|nr:manganese efflux pump [Lachnospiraceae bacterium]
MDLLFFINSCMLGVGLAMDAFSVSIADGLSDPVMKKHRMIGIAGTFALFQFMMPMIGWLCIHKIAERFEAFRVFIPWIALALLAYIGIGMIREGIAEKKKGTDKDAGPGAESDTGTDYKNRKGKLSIKNLMIQGIATSIDAMSVGFAIAEYQVVEALACSLIIFALTFVICIAGLIFGKRFGEKLAENATIGGGIILIAIGLEILIKALI